MTAPTTYTFTWDFNRFETSDGVHGTFNDVVNKVYFTLWGQDSEGRRIPYYGNFEVGHPDPATFVPFQDLTPNMVETWAQDNIGEDKISRITDQLIVQLNQDDVVNPVKISAPPWQE